MRQINLRGCHRQHAVMALLFGMFFVSTRLSAAPPMLQCYVASDNTFIANPEPFELGASIEGKIPGVAYDDGTPSPHAIGIRWSPQEKGTSVAIEQIASFRGKWIYRLIYRSEIKDRPDGITAPLCTLFAYQESSNQFRLRPFFILDGDEELASVESYIESSKEYSFSLEIEQSMKGNGVFWTSYLFAFTPQEAFVVERREGGRHMHAKTYRYNKVGKVISVKTDAFD